MTAPANANRRTYWVLGGLLAGWPLAVGCDGSTSARETTRAALEAADAERTPSAGAVAPPDAAPTTAAVAAPRSPAAVIETTFDDVKFAMEKSDLFQRSMLTPKIESLAGQQIRIRGYIYPTPRRRGLKEFVLVRDNMECCFGPGAALFDCILVRMAPGKTAEFSIRPIAVEGEFQIQEFPGPDGRPLAIYQMTAEAVQ